MECKNIEELLSDYIEKELKKELELEVEKHLKNCNSCYELHISLRNLINTGPKISEEVPFYLKNRLMYIPELIDLQEEKTSNSHNIKLIAAMVGIIVLLLNIFYFTNIYPQGNYFLHKTIAKIERFVVDTKEYVLKKESIKNNFLISFLDKHILSKDEENYIKWDINNGDSIE